MTVMTQSEIVGADLEWYACDQEGKVGFFTLFLNSRLPVSIASSFEAFEAVAEYMGRLPARGEAVLVRVGGHDEEDWILAARRGLYAFDGSATGTGPNYELVASPTSPITLDDLETEISSIVARTQFSGCFRHEREIIDARRFGELTTGLLRE